MSMKKEAVTFKAFFKRIDSKILASQDKGAALTFEIDSPSDELMDSLNRLQKPDQIINVGVWK
jgi:hypothetical protein